MRCTGLLPWEPAGLLSSSHSLILAGHEPIEDEWRTLRSGAVAVSHLHLVARRPGSLDHGKGPVELVVDQTRRFCWVSDATRNC